jgi:GTP cyclohydrolase IA
MATNKNDILEKNISIILKELLTGLETKTLSKTPARVAKSLRFLTSGYHIDPNTIICEALFESDMNEMVMVKNIELHSLCEHHLLPFFGKCHIAYIPNGKIIGLSKIPRIVDIFARRLQTQEHLTQQIAEAIRDITGATGVGVVMTCQHFCMAMRGVQQHHADTSTIFTLGRIHHEESLRTEFLSSVHQD